MLIWIIIGIVIALVLLLFLARKSFCRSVRREVISRAKQAMPNLEILKETESQLICRRNDIEFTVNLDNLFQNLAGIKDNEPEERETVMSDFVKALEGSFAWAAGDITIGSNQIMPRLVTEKTLDGIRKVCAPLETPHRSFGVSGLFVVYVYDMEHQVSYLHQKHLEDIGLSADQVHSAALENLRADFPEKFVRMAMDKDRLNVLKTGDTYDATRLLLVPEHLKEGESMLAAIPDRDTLILMRMPESDEHTSLKDLAGKTSGEPLFNRLIKVTRHGFEVME